MTKDQLKAKYARISHDDSQLEMFKNDLIDGEIPVGAEPVEIAGNSLVIPEQPAPEPVINIDSVDYFHKQEFDVDDMMNLPENSYLNILTGEATEESYPCLAKRLFGPGSGIPGVLLMVRNNATSSELTLACEENQYGVKPEYTSHAFILVDDPAEIGEFQYNRIYLPTCSAYYGFLSEDGKTFVSYYNLKGEGAPEFVDSVKQGNAVIPLKDDRLPAAEAADAGKVLKVADAGGYELGEAGGGSVEIAGTSLVIPEQPVPEPVITIDGVDYYHKYEFDLTKFTLEDRDNYYDILTGEVSQEPFVHAYINITLYGPNYPSGSIVTNLASYRGNKIFTIYVVAQGTSTPASVNYTSRAFTVVDTPEEVTDKTKICLPTCSAYYGFLSEDGKTFISYFNLKTDGAPEFVDSVKQGNAVIPVKDVRLPDATTADVGKVLAVNEDGELVLQPTSGGGTKLYRHCIQFDINSSNDEWCKLTFVSTKSAAITSLSTLFDELGLNGNYKSYGTVEMCEYHRTSVSMYCTRIYDTTNLIAQYGFLISGTYPGGSISIHIYTDSILTKNPSNDTIDITNSKMATCNVNLSSPMSYTVTEI